MKELLEFRILIIFNHITIDYSGVRSFADLNKIFRSTCNPRIKFLPPHYQGTSLNSAIRSTLHPLHLSPVLELFWTRRTETTKSKDCYQGRVFDCLQLLWGMPQGEDRRMNSRWHDVDEEETQMLALITRVQHQLTILGQLLFYILYKKFRRPRCTTRNETRAKYRRNIFNQGTFLWQHLISDIVISPQIMK